MIHPSELLRTNSTAEERFSAPIGHHGNDIDCGLSTFPSLNKWLKLDRFAKPTVFVVALSILGVFHGIVITYFRGTSKIWSSIYRIVPEAIDWILYLNEVLTGIFGIGIAYWGNRIHRPNWIGGTTIFLAIAAFFLAIPEFEGHAADTTQITGAALCQREYRGKLSLSDIKDDYPIIEFVILVVYQIFMAVASISFITHGLSYIDDNMSPSQSPIYLALTLSSIEIGRQIGLYCSWTPLVIQIGSVFTSAVWIIIIVLLFHIGGIVTFFPRVMPNTLIKKSVTSLLNLAAGNPTQSKEEPVDGHWKTLWRLIKNRILMITIFSIVFMQSALVNFGILEKHFNQSKYHVPKNGDTSGYSDIWLVQFTSNLLKQPMIAISMVCSGMIVAKFRPKPRYLVVWNVVVFSIVAILFASTRFWNCVGGLENEVKHQLITPYCSANCGCSLDGSFSPVCVNNRTFFSPCLAGCSAWDNELQVYKNCSCSYTKGHASDGSCYAENCKLLLSLSQVNNIISAGLLSSTVVPHLMIIIRSVKDKDKAVALGLLLAMMGKIAYLPIRAIYQTVTNKFCEIYGEDNCQFYSPSFSIFLASATVTLMVLAALFGMLLLCFINDLDLYKDNVQDEDLEERYEKEDTNESTEAELTEDTRDENLRETTAMVHHNRDDSDSDESGISTLTKTKRERIEKYLSQGDLVPPLVTNNNNKGKSKTAGTSESPRTTSGREGMRPSMDHHETEF